MSKLVSWFLVNEVQTLPTELSMSHVNKLEFCVIWYGVLHVWYKQTQNMKNSLSCSGFVLFCFGFSQHQTTLPRRPSRGEQVPACVPVATHGSSPFQPQPPRGCPCSFAWGLHGLLLGCFFAFVGFLKLLFLWLGDFRHDWVFWWRSRVAGEMLLHRAGWKPQLFSPVNVQLPNKLLCERGLLWGLWTLEHSIFSQRKISGIKKKNLRLLLNPSLWNEPRVLSLMYRSFMLLFQCFIVFHPHTVTSFPLLSVSYSSECQPAKWLHFFILYPDELGFLYSVTPRLWPVKSDGILSS